MTVTTNPYQTPAATDDGEPWWSRLRRLFTFRDTTPTPTFRDGGKVITDGIAFYLDIADPKRLYAASPTTVHTDERMNLVASEAIRVFPLFLRDNPKLQSFVRGRKLTIRLIATYADAPTAYIREHALHWDYISAVLDDTPDRE